MRSLPVALASALTVAGCSSAHSPTPVGPPAHCYVLQFGSWSEGYRVARADSFALPRRLDLLTERVRPEITAFKAREFPAREDGHTVLAWRHVRGDSIEVLWPDPGGWSAFELRLGLSEQGLRGRFGWGSDVVFAVPAYREVRATEISCASPA